MAGGTAIDEVCRLAMVGNFWIDFIAGSILGALKPGRSAGQMKIYGLYRYRICRLWEVTLLIKSERTKNSSVMPW
jgi:hypothetical protein